MPELAEIIEKLTAELEELRADKTNKMQDIDANTAFELGFESCIYTLKNIVEPPQIEVGLMFVDVPETKEIAE